MTKEYGFERAGVSGHGSSVTLRARPVSVLMTVLLCKYGESLLRMPEPWVIRPGSAYHAKRRDDRADFLARLQYQLGREAAGVPA